LARRRNGRRSLWINRSRRDGFWYIDKGGAARFDRLPPAIFAAFCSDSLESVDDRVARNRLAGTAIRRN